MTNVDKPETNGIPSDDTREKLEAAAQTEAGYIYGRGFTNGLADAWDDYEVDTAANQIIQLLDRQAAITERESERLIIEQQTKLDDFDGESYCGATVTEWYDLAGRLQEELDGFECTHMRLPVDADGVPIRPGDTIHRTTSAVDNVVTVIGVNEREFFFCGPNFTEPGIKKNVGNAVRHVKPETVEGIIAEAMSLACEPEAPFSESSEYVKQFAERIRKAVEHG